MSVQSPCTPLRLRLSSEGEILGWLVAGPYPNEGALARRGTGFRTDYLNPESSADPSEGDTSGNHSWKFALADPKRGIDLMRAVAARNEAIAYCYTRIDSSADRDALLLFGSDDGAKVYLNGVDVYSKQIARRVRRDEETVPIHLKEGVNRLLFKIEQGDGGLGLTARIVDFDKRPIAGIAQSLNVQAGEDDPLKLVRQLAGQSRPFDLESFCDFESIRAKASRWLPGMRDRALDPDRLEKALLAQEVASAPAEPNALAEALRTDTPKLQSAFGHARSKALTWAQNPGPQVNAKPELEDFVKVMPGGRYFVHSDGRPFIPISCNHNPDWTEAARGNPLSPDYDPAKVEAWFAQLESGGVNVVRMMVETPPSGNLEDPAGVFSPEHLIWLDSIFASARKHRIKLWVTPYDTFWMSLRADTSTYWALNGGPIDRPIQFLTDPGLLKLQEARMKLLIDRYGNTGDVFAWEVMNEIDIWWGANPEQIREWTDKMVAFVRSYQKKRWGRDHLITISFADAEPKGGNAETAFRRPDLDFATMHLYLGASRHPGPGDVVQSGIDFAAGVRYARAKIRDNRPVLDGESGPIDHWVDDEILDDSVFHEMSWRHLMAGGAGPGTRWPYRHPHQITAGMLRTLKAMRSFCDEVPWSNLTGPEVAVNITAPVGSDSAGFGTENAGIAWIRLPAGANGKDISLTLNGAKPSRVRFFNIPQTAWVAAPTNATELAIYFER
jgi:mannan endo-1,4-beta-mannosidase